MKLFRMCCRWLLDFSMLLSAWEKEYSSKVKGSIANGWVCRVPEVNGRKPVHCSLAVHVYVPGGLIQSHLGVDGESQVLEISGA